MDTIGPCTLIIAADVRRADASRSALPASPRGEGEAAPLRVREPAAGPGGRPTALTIAIKAFTLTFVAEWGDRSQISTIGLAVSTVSLKNVEI